MEDDVATFPSPVTYDVWVSVIGHDSYASNAAANATFALTMENLCYQSSVSCSSTEEIADYVYSIPADITSATEQTVPASSTCVSDKSVGPNTCALTTTLEHYDTATKTW